MHDRTTSSDAPQDHDTAVSASTPSALDEPAVLLDAVAAALRWAEYGGARAVERVDLELSWPSASPSPAAASAASRAGSPSVRAQAPTPGASPATAKAAAPARPSQRPLPPTGPAGAGPSAGLRLHERPRLIPTPPAPAPGSGAAAAPPRAPASRPASADPAAAIAALHARVGDCTRCDLAAGRSAIVHGRGDPRARLVVVLSGPDRAADAAGTPLAGEAQALFAKMLGAIGMGLDTIWLTSLVRCALPPAGGEGGGAAARAPSREEVRACVPILAHEVDIIRPSVILALGEPAARFLLREPSAAMPALRERWHEARGVPTIASWAPSELLAVPARKREAWLDLQEVARRLGDRPDRRG